MRHRANFYHQSLIKHLQIDLLFFNMPLSNFHLSIKIYHHCQEVLVHTFNPSTWEVEAGGSLNSMQSWSTEKVQGQATEKSSLKKTRIEKSIIYHVFICI